MIAARTTQVDRLSLRRVAALGVLMLIAGGLAWGPPASAAVAQRGYVRFAHFAPSAGLATVTIDGVLLTSTASFQTVTPYRSLSSGTHTVTVATATTAGHPITGQAVVAAGGAITVAAVDAPTGPAVEMFNDDLSSTAPGDAKVRVIQAVGAVGSVTAEFALISAAASGGAAPAPVVIPAVGFGTASPYMALAAGSYTVSIKNTAGVPVIAGTNWPVVSGTVASLAIIQSTSGPTLEVLRDAAGAAAAPMGGMATGFGGTAKRPAGAPWIPMGLIGLAVLAAGTVTLRRVKPFGSRRP